MTAEAPSDPSRTGTFSVGDTLTLAEAAKSGPPLDCVRVKKIYPDAGEPGRFLAAITGSYAGSTFARSVSIPCDIALSDGRKVELVKVCGEQHDKVQYRAWSDRHIKVQTPDQAESGQAGQ